MIYFCHGVPGAPSEASLLGLENVVAPNLLAAAPLAQFDINAADAPDGSAHLIGFSIGAMVALQLAASRPDKVCKVTFIAPAMHLTPGGFPPDMAGKPVFRMAKRFPSFLGFVAELQCLGFRIAHDFVLDRFLPNRTRMSGDWCLNMRYARRCTRGCTIAWLITQPPMCRQSVPTWVTGRGLANGHLPCCNLAWQGGQFGADCDV